MRYTFLILFGLMFMGLNALNAQTCCEKAKASATASANVSEKKSCDMAKTTASSNCSESASSALVPAGVSFFVSGGTNAKATTKACDPTTCDLTKCDLSKCDASKCDPSKCPKTGAMKASTAKATVPAKKATAAL